ncbi:kelch repeat-containing protein [Cryptococcus neoformans A2-102-5]|uniref:Kelch repeat-containing protein n=1 Tax=Cryptococcus neoformans Tu259-1 TaxID=1230072 RepID=A0A854QL28_CRYNE|nr:kelch repeat-containing protein [Cryptococcus neoformans var. grubii AD1-83a]OXC87239.1 kelch repeat-containing protein [Cryptococcus neoformans var. grubii AD1-7a]OXG28755.1 kelch repeat-containing protein [Cryptococcus neoformans var. grubii Tu259-1]OXG40675.1 kelch repeat-containing protein [Cryptococcus neoformans var. grubii Bt15]OXG45339.1 kelch repeat-containing protein [Cryptococcus neoformans var. grubii Bt120]OXG69053.1 kelch repeat-containing protein [Cryptococcus neoformans var.
MTHPGALSRNLPEASLPRSDPESSDSTRKSTSVPSANADAAAARRLPAHPSGLHASRTDPCTPAGELDNAYEQTAARRRRAGTRSERPSTQPNTDSKGQRTYSRTAYPRKPLEPRLPSAKNVPRAPASSMYFSPVPCYGFPPNQALRAHTGTLVGERIWVIGGVDKQTCFRDVACFDTESFMWSILETQGERFPPLRAHTTTLVGDKLFIFGGGDGPSYSNDVWILDTTTHRFSRPSFSPDLPLPPPRRAHSTVLYQHYLIVFGGGNGQAALNDVWALDVSDPNALTWTEWKTRGDIPQKKGYHTANLIGDKMVVFGGSDGHASFADVHVLNLKTCVWTLINTDIKHNRLSHTSTQVGSYLFVIGGHNGQAYAQDVLLFNLVTLQWEVKLPRGIFPPGRGYHVALLHDARIFLSGGYNGETVFDDFWILDLSASAYLPQVTTFQVDENLSHLDDEDDPLKYFLSGLI